MFIFSRVMLPLLENFLTLAQLFRLRGPSPMGKITRKYCSLLPLTAYLVKPTVLSSPHILTEAKEMSPCLSLMLWKKLASSKVKVRKRLEPPLWKTRDVYFSPRCDEVNRPVFRYTFLMSFFKNTCEITLIIGVHSGAVEVAEVMFAEGRIPEVLSCARETIKNYSPATRESEASEIGRAVRSALAVLQRQISDSRHSSKRVRVKKAFVCFSSPWVLGSTRVVRLAKDKSFTTTKKMVEELIAAERMAIMKVPELANYRIIEEKIMRFKLNGYEASDGVGKHVSEFGIEVYFGAVAEIALDAIEKEVHSAFNHRILEFSTLPFVAFTIFRDLPNGDNHFLSIVVGERATDISIVKRGCLLEAISMPFGTGHCFDAIQDKLNTTASVARSFFKLFVEGRAEEGITEKIKLALEKPHLQFKALLGESLNGVSEEFFIPKSVYISVEDGLFPWFAAALADLGSSRVVD